MLIVIPFCAKDEWLASKNLELCAKMDGKTNYACLLSYDSGTNPDKIEQLAKRVFSQVHHCKYTKWEGEAKWPNIQNWAWQETVRHIYSHFRDSHWLWWEADATPLVGGWMDRLSAEYATGGQPFMGHVVSKMGHMNGVAIYPGDILKYSIGDVMLARHRPWDIALKDYINTVVHPANHIMAHFPRYNGITLSFTDKAALTELKKRGYVLFHGCNDGSLVDLVAGRKAEPKLNCFNRFYNVADIDAEFDEAEPLWQMEYMRLAKAGYGCVDYNECRKPTPSFTGQTKWESGHFDLELSPLVCHFNPGLTRDKSGTLWLLARKWDRTAAAEWVSTIVAYRLTNDLKVNGHIELRSHKRNQYDNHEDPRVVFNGDSFWVSYVSWVPRGEYAAKQMFSAFDSEWSYQRTIQPRYGKNIHGTTGVEKNWIWFSHEGSWHFVYGFSPHIVVRVGNEVPIQEFKTELKPPWNYGEIRGGTPPVRVGDEYISFFHSSLPWKNRQKRYYMGAYAFEAAAPFRVTRMTEKPLLSGSENDSRTLGGPPCIFPCGALHEGNQWLVTFGVNDEKCGWIKIPHKDLERKLVAV